MDVHGPTPANGANNDASILKAMLSDKYNEEARENNRLGFKDYLEAEDHLVLDRGFRDCKPELEAHGLKHSMPAFIPNGESKLSTEDANASRKVTMIRWPVEACNGQLKNRFHLLDNVIPILYLPLIDSFVRIGCALINKYGKRVFTEKARHEKLAQQVEERLQLRNLLKEKVVNPDGRIAHSKPQWQKVTVGALEGFPKMTESDIELITLGPYQIQQGKRYNVQHLDGSALYEFYIHKHSEALIQVQLRSRFRRALTHNVYVEFSKEESRLPEQRILGWFCRCECGSRNLGCCSHVAAVLLYFGCMIHDEKAFENSRTPFKLINSLDYDIRKETRRRKDCTQHIEEESENTAPDHEFLVPSVPKRGKHNIPSLDGPF